MNEPQQLYDIDWMREHWDCKRPIVFGYINKYKTKTVNLGKKR